MTRRNDTSIDGKRVAAAFLRTRLAAVAFFGCLSWFAAAAYLAGHLLGDWPHGLRPVPVPPLVCSLETILTKNALVACVMLAGRYLAFIPTLFGLTVNGAVSGIAYFPLLTPENVMLMPLIIYGLFEEGAFVIIATITLCWRASLDEDSERSWRFSAAHVPFAAAMLLTGAVLESTLCS